MIETIAVQLAERSYPILVGPGALADPSLVTAVRGRSAVIISDEQVAPHWLARVVAPLKAAGKSVREIVLPAGEATKSVEHLARLWDQLLGWQCDRQTTLIALGGGVVGDLVGFAAATYQRGVPFIQIPTTLLAQVDSSVGGKTAINHPLGKNMIGAFHQPVAVFADTNTLGTLPEREFRSGLGEVLKHGLIVDMVEFARLERELPAILARDPQALTRMIARSCAIKAEIVARDEREGSAGVRAWLNLGHTFGHAIEAGLGYGAWLHGEAVAAGCCVAAELSRRLGHLDQAEVARVVQAFAAAGLPTRAPRLQGAAHYRELMAIDKKAEGGAIRYVLLKQMGEATVSAVDAALVDAALEASFEAATT